MAAVCMSKMLIVDIIALSEDAHRWNSNLFLCKYLNVFYSLCLYFSFSWQCPCFFVEYSCFIVPQKCSFKYRSSTCVGWFSNRFTGSRCWWGWVSGLEQSFFYIDPCHSLVCFLLYGWWGVVCVLNLMDQLSKIHKIGRNAGLLMHQVLSLHVESSYIYENGEKVCLLHSYHAIFVYI